MNNYKPLITSVNVDVIYINGVYQDEGKSLCINPEEIKAYHCYIELSCGDNRHIKIGFYSISDFNDFVKCYQLK